MSAKMTPEFVRGAAQRGVHLAVAPADCAMLADAIEIADACARSDIESFCGWETVGNVRWYDLDSAKSENLDFTEPVALAERYLAARGLLLRHSPERPKLVRFVESA